MLRSLTLAMLAALPGTALAQVVPAGGSPNQDVIVSAFNASPLVTPELTNARQSLSTLGAGERNAALSAFAPSGYSLLPELTLRAAEFQEQSVRRYLRDYRAGGTGVGHRRFAEGRRGRRLPRRPGAGMAGTLARQPQGAGT